MSAVSLSLSDWLTSKGRGQGEKQSVRRKSSLSILTQKALWYCPGSSDMGADVWVSFTWKALHTADLLRLRAHLFESV